MIGYGEIKSVIFLFKKPIMKIELGRIRAFKIEFGRIREFKIELKRNNLESNNMSIDNVNDIPSLTEEDIQKVRDDLFHGIAEEFKENGLYVESLNYTNPELNHVLSVENTPKIPFEYQEEQTLLNYHKNMKAVSKKVDLHGYTKYGASQALRRSIINSDRHHPNYIKAIVGRGIHSKDQPVMPTVVREVSSQMNLPPPSMHKSNEGYMIIFVPQKKYFDDDNDQI